MQRINLFTSPDFSNGLWGSGDKTVANGELTVGPGGGEYCAINFSAPPDVGQLVFSIEVKGGGNIQVFDTDWKYLVSSGEFRDVADWTVKNLRFTPTAGKAFMICFYHGNGSAVKARRPQLELASTYDAAVGGGASGLLHRRHHATRLTPAVGVMPDDGHEPMHEPILDHHLVDKPLGGYHDHSEKARDEIFGQRLCERHRRHYLDERVWRRKREPTCQLRIDRQQCQSGVNELFRRVRQSDRHRDEYTPLHVGRISGEQDPARQHRIFHRGHDAARLTLLGVVA